MGLSIVRQAIEALGGTVDVASTRGAGTTFTLDVPLSIATMRVIIAAIGTSRVAIPSAFVMRALRLRKRDIVTVDGTPALLQGGAPVLLAHLGGLLGPPYASSSEGDVHNVILLEAGTQHLATIVDDLLDEREIVLRPLEHVNEEAAALVVGTALLGTGQVLLVLGVPALITDALRRSGFNSALAPVSARTREQVRTRILVADDSITSRTLEQSVLEGAGYDVTTAVDGAEAWRLLERAEFALVVSDVEMPNLDGIGLCERIRATPRTSALPVILVTSLDAPEHRARGMEAGADAYVAKSSFDQDDLLDTVRMLLGRTPAVMF